MKQKVYDFRKTIPAGKVVTYRQIALYPGNPRLCRAFGSILHNYPDPINQICYKVVNCRGELSAHFGDGGMDAQRQRPEADGIRVINNRVDLSVYGHIPPYHDIPRDFEDR